MKIKSTESDCYRLGADHAQDLRMGEVLFHLLGRVPTESEREQYDRGFREQDTARTISLADARALADLAALLGCTESEALARAADAVRALLAL